MKPEKWDILKAILKIECTKPLDQKTMKIPEVNIVDLFLYMNQSDKTFEEYDETLSITENIKKSVPYYADQPLAS